MIIVTGLFAVALEHTQEDKEGLYFQYHVGHSPLMHPQRCSFSACQEIRNTEFPVPVVELHLGLLPLLEAAGDVGGSPQHVFHVQEKLLVGREMIQTTVDQEFFVVHSPS